MSSGTGSLIVDGEGYYLNTNVHGSPKEGSVKSDEGYHSNEYHDDVVLTPPEDSSSDSDCDNNFVLDFSVKKPNNGSNERPLDTIVEERTTNGAGDNRASDEQRPDWQAKKDQQMNDADDPTSGNEFR